MKNAWVIRPYPHGHYRLKEFLNDDMVAIGWPHIGDLTKYHSLEHIKKVVQKYYEYSSAHSLGQKCGNINRFINDISVGDYILVPDGQYVYVGEIRENYKYVKKYDSNKEGFCHQRPVKWFFDKKAILRSNLTGRVYDSLKGRQTVFSTYVDEIEELVEKKKYLFSEKPNFNLKKEYLRKLQSGLLVGVNSNLFEDAVCELFSKYFPSLRRLSTRNSKSGDTDLIADLPGDVVVRIQVKHFYVLKGDVEVNVVDQLAKSMKSYEHGIIVTSGKISEKANKYADTLTDKQIRFYNGEEFVDLLFENLENLRPETLALFGLTSKIELL